VIVNRVRRANSAVWRRRPRRLACAASVLLLLALGCSTRYSPSTVREEISRQRGVAPQSTFEIDLGRMTMYMIRSALNTADEKGPFEGLRAVQLAVFELPQGSGPALDVTRFGVRGWERVVRAHDERRSFMILVRSTGETSGSDPKEYIGDLVVVGAGAKRVVYGRLKGSLNPELPSRLSEIFERGGPEQIADSISGLVEGASP